MPACGLALYFKKGNKLENCQHKNETKIKIFIARRGYLCHSVVFHKAGVEKGNILSVSVLGCTMWLMGS